jgi:frataxin-like iron-binding protein CyaY
MILIATSITKKIEILGKIRQNIIKGSQLTLHHYKKGQIIVQKFKNNNKILSYSTVANLHKFILKNPQIIKSSQKDKLVIMLKTLKEGNKKIRKSLSEL